MEWTQQCPEHRNKGYTLDLLFASSDTCRRVVLSDELLIGHPAHHENLYFVLQNSASPKCSDSENNPIKNFYRANYELIPNWTLTGIK